MVHANFTAGKSARIKFPSEKEIVGPLAGIGEYMETYAE